MKNMNVVNGNNAPFPDYMQGTSRAVSKCVFKCFLILAQRSSAFLMCIDCEWEYEDCRGICACLSHICTNGDLRHTLFRKVV